VEEFPCGVGRLSQEVNADSRSLTVSIVNTRQWDWLEPCLRSVLDHPYKSGPFHIIVLDNASADGSVEKIGAAFPEVRLIAENIRRGFGANHGRVAAVADSDLILFLNPDTLMHEGTLDRLVEAFDADVRVVAAGGPIIDPSGETWRASPFPFPTPGRSLREAVALHRKRPSPVAPDGVSIGDGWLSGSALMMDRRVFQAMGGFDPRFFLYFEETDLAKRLTEAGGRIAFRSDAPVVHEGETTERAASPRNRVSAAEMRTTTEFERSAIAYMRKHFGRSGATVYRGALLLGGTIRWRATLTPVATRMALHGESIDSTRAHHRRRIGVAINPSSGLSIGDGASEWNRQNAGRTSLDAGG
jgi:N-acetylglucosaminyl-diphospho-decaprenol L-rhamnosyltransferase